MFKLFKKKAANEIATPIEGEVILLDQVSDPVFSSKAMGDGFAVRPVNNKVFSPVRGKVVSIFPTKHAIGLTDDEGNEVLLHIGIDTVSLAGAGFNVLVAEGETVDFETQLVEVDFDYLQQQEKETTTMVIFTNLADRTLEIKTGPASAGSIIGKIK